MNEEATPDIIESLQMVSPPEPYAWVRPAIYILGALLLLGALFYFLYRKKLLPYQERPALPPDVIALNALAGIRHYLDSDKYKEFVSEISKILRYYIEGRFMLKAPNLSTEEFLYIAEKSEELAPEHREKIAEFLAKCDRVKFALAGMEKPAMTELYQAVELLIQQTRPTVAPEVAPAGKP